MYNDEHYGGSKASYDGELIPLKDAQIRYKRDRELQEKYREAEEALSEEQLTFEDVKEKLEEREVPRL